MSLKIKKSKANLTVGDLMCEYRRNPMGIDIKQPRLSWRLFSDERGQLQTAYQVLVSDSLEKLNQDQGNLWDSGLVKGDQSIHIRYDGVDLQSEMRCWWKVRVWEKSGTPSDYSSPSLWQMGLLNCTDWLADWIAFDVKTTSGMEMKPPVYLRKSVEISKTIARATAYITAKGVYEFHLNGQRIGEAVLTPGFTDYNKYIQYQTYDVTQILEIGQNTMGAILGEGWYCGHIGMRAKRNYFGTFPQFLMQINIEYTDGTKTSLMTDDSWRGSFGPIQCSDMLIGEKYDASLELLGWDQSGYNDEDWKNVEVISPAVGFPQKETSENPQVITEVNPISCMEPSPGVYVYEMDRTISGWVNLLLQGELGQKVTLRYAQMIDTADYKNIYTENLISPEWVTSFILEGEDPKVYENTRVVEGFRYIELSGLAEAPDMEAIIACVVRSEVEHTDLVAQRSVPIKVTGELKPIAVTQPDEGTHIFDLGQNMVGWVRLHVQGHAGTKIQLRHGERLHEDGTLYTENLRSALSTDIFILQGNGPEVFEPHFTFHGFRYVEVTGYPGEPSLDSLTGCVVHSDMPQTGKFECSNKMINQLWQNILWTQRGNSISVPTDCPQRDERLGWLADASRFILTACFNMFAGSFYMKWAKDIFRAQSPEGAFYEVAPRVVTSRYGAPGSGDAGIIVPWTMYKVYGDTKIIEENFEAMAAWMNYIQEANSDYLWTKRLSANYGDWLSYYAATPLELIATAFWALDASLMAEMAKAIGRNKMHKEYQELYNKVKGAFVEAYVKDDGRIEGDTQTGYAMALAIDLFPENLRGKAVGYLEQDIERKGGHLSTGNVGTKFLGPVLAQYGLVDTLYQLLNNETCPSWGYWIKNGATTSWERWDAKTQVEVMEDSEESSFHHYKFKARVGMNSFNHPAFGSVGECLYRYLAGIDFVNGLPGFKSFVIHPRPSRDVSFATAEIQSMYGRILSNWEIEHDKFRLHVIIPSNTHAMVYLPTTDLSSVHEDAGAMNQSELIEFIGVEEEKVLLSVKSGEYFFTCPYG